MGEDWEYKSRQGRSEAESAARSVDGDVERVGWDEVLERGRDREWEGCRWRGEVEVVDRVWLTWNCVVSSGGGWPALNYFGASVWVSINFFFFCFVGKWMILTSSILFYLELFVINFDQFYLLIECIFFDFSIECIYIMSVVVRTIHSGGYSVLFLSIFWYQAYHKDLTCRIEKRKNQNMMKFILSIFSFPTYLRL